MSAPIAATIGMPGGVTVTSAPAISAPMTAARGAPGRRSCGLSSARKAAGNIASMPRSRGSPIPPPASAPASVPAFQKSRTERPVNRNAVRARSGESWACAIAVLSSITSCDWSRRARRLPVSTGAKERP